MMKIINKKIVEPAKQLFNKIYHINDTPEKIALGFAIGAFIGIFPTFWLGGLITVWICSLLKLNYISAIIGSVIIMNPITTPIFWTLSALLGSAIFSDDSQQVIDAIKSGTVLKSFDKIALIYLTGNIIIAFVVSVVSFLIIKKILVKQKRKNI